MKKFKSKSPALIASIVTAAFVFLSACHHNPLNSNLSKSWQPLSHSLYNKVLQKNTRAHKEYSGLHMTFQSHLVFLNSEIQVNQTKIKSQYKNWSENEAQKEMSQLNASLKQSSHFFLSFYSPNKKRNKLDQRASDWRIILKTKSSEFEGEISFEDKISNHTKVFYPHIELWGKPYKVSFPISTVELETSPFSVILMGPEGMATFKY